MAPLAEGNMLRNMVETNMMNFFNRDGRTEEGWGESEEVRREERESEKCDISH